MLDGELEKGNHEKYLGNKYFSYTTIHTVCLFHEVRLNKRSDACSVSSTMKKYCGVPMNLRGGDV